MTEKIAKDASSVLLTPGKPALLSKESTKPKPTKLPVDPNTPLSERINMSRVSGLQVQGPSVDHAPEAIVGHYQK